MVSPVFNAATSSSNEGFSEPAVQTKDLFFTGPISVPLQPQSSGKNPFFRGIYSVFGLSSHIPKNLLPASTVSEELKNEFKQLKSAFMELEADKVREFDLKLENNHKCSLVNGMALFVNPLEKLNFDEKHAQEQKWMIHFLRRESFYEKNLFQLQDIGRHLNINILVFNYRGVGESVGEFTKPEDLILDGEACVNYLLSKGVVESNILIQGHQLGGAVGIRVAGLHENIGLIAINSFNSLSKAASAEIKFTGEFLAANGWDYDSVSAFEKIKAKKLIVYNKQDAIIPYREASLYKGLKDKIKMENPGAVEKSLHKGKIKSRLKPEYKPLSVKLQKDFGGIKEEAHDYEFLYDEAFSKIREFVESFFEDNLSADKG